MFPIANDAVVLGLLAVTLAGIFYAASLPQFKKFFTFVPSLLLCYFIPAAFNSLGIISPNWISSEMLLFGGEYYNINELIDKRCTQSSNF